MASLTTTITESVVLNGEEQGGKTTKSFTGVTQVFKRTMDIVTSRETVIYQTHATDFAGNVFNPSNIKYARITNLDTTNYIDLIVENAAGDEVGLKLAAGKSLLLYDHESSLQAVQGDVTVTTEVAATAAMTVTDGDAASGMAVLTYVDIIATNGTARRYAIVDDNATTVATGDLLAVGSDYGADVLAAGHAAVGAVAVAINTTGSASTQNAYLVQLKAAIEHANGHKGLITVSAVPGEANGSQLITLTQVTKGASGNTTTTETIANFTAADFTSGVDSLVTSKANILSLVAIANAATCKCEVFIATS